MYIASMLKEAPGGKRMSTANVDRVTGYPLLEALTERLAALRVGHENGLGSACFSK
jgi:hypothetical protein